MVLSLHNLHKSFMTGFANNIKRDILKGVNLSITAGEIYGFLGSNGAGKTTTLDTIMGFHTPNQSIPEETGQILFFGKQELNNTIRKRIGYAPDKTPYFDHLTGRENVMLIASYADVAKEQRETYGQELFDELGLAYAQDNYVQTYSQGMKQRLGLILSLINNPDLLLRDEPMSGLDPLGRIVVKNLMKKLQSQGKTIIFSTHILSDVQEIADRFGILANGIMVYENTVDAIDGNLEELFCDIVSKKQQLHTMKIQ